MVEGNNKQTILVVDDTPENIDVLRGILKEEYKIKVALNGAKALEIVVTSPPDLILLDIMMPDMDGYEVCRRLKDSAFTRKIPVIFVTAKGEIEDETLGFELGAVDYITKPVSPPIVKARVKTQLAIYDQNKVLEEKVLVRTRELAVTQDVTILGLASLAETRDNETGGHIMRTQRYIRTLAEQLMTHESFKSYLDEETVDLLYKSAPLHDIGKVGVPDKILLKPGKLDDDEFDIMKKHTTYGRDSILRAEEAFAIEGGNSNSTFLSIAREIAYIHHEKWDGTGYPEGIAGDKISIPGRLMAIADVYDALICKRVYKPPFTHRKAKEIIIEGRGKHFCPDVVNAFAETEEIFRQIALEFADHDEERAALEES
ncbi:two-component system response regulator [Candidatus Latescibacterota bacterium]